MARLTMQSFIPLAALSCCLAGAFAPAAETTPRNVPVLLVPGMTWNVDRPKPVWGHYQKNDSAAGRWTGMIGFLDSHGHVYGGTLRPKQARVDLPECLDTEGVRVDPRTARLFVLEFSPSANADGLAHKGLELAEAVRRLCRFTGAKRVNLVAHSAGGLAARAYLQGALPGVQFRHDVDRLITIGTPHLGAAVASSVGDLLGTRATSISHDAPMIVQLNQTLQLPPDVRFASIVVRGFAADVRGKGGAYDELVDDSLVARLPIDYRRGGDQVVHVLTQNLRLAPCATVYERRTKRPVQYLLARVDDPSHVPGGRRVHGAAPGDPSVQQLVVELLTDDFFWNTQNSEKRLASMERQARLHAISAIEAAVLDDHSASEVKQVRLADFRRTDHRGNTSSYAFDGKARSANRVVPLRRRWTRVRGTLLLEFDPFGRVVAAKVHVDQRKDL